METGVKDIKNVRITEDDLHLMYEVTAKDICDGNCSLCISCENTTDVTKRLPATSTWYGASGKLTIDKSLVTQGDELYLYISDQDSGITSSIVKVYSERAQLKRWTISDRGELVLYVRRNSPLFHLSDKLVLAYSDCYGKKRTCFIELPHMRIGLDELDVAFEDPRFTFTLNFHMKDGQAEINGAPTPEIDIYPSGPDIQSVSYIGNRLDVQLSGRPETATVIGELYEDGVRVLNAELEDGKMDVSNMTWSRNAVYTLRAWYKNDTGTSPKSDPVVVEVRKPDVEFCEFSGGLASLKLAVPAVYQYDYGDGLQTVSGDSVTVPDSAKELSIAIKRGLYTGPSLDFKLQQRAFYPLAQANGQTLYFYGERPDDMTPGQELAIQLDRQAVGWKDYDGTCFALTKTGDEKLLLKVKTAYYTTEPAEIETDYLSMTEAVLSLESTAESDSLLNDIRMKIIENVPIPAGEYAFFHYGYNPQDGYTDIFEGMSLLTEYAVYQNVPDEVGTSVLDGLSGFAGSGTARYTIIRRNGKLTVDPFAGSMNFDVPPPTPMSGDAKLQGGAGMADLLFKDFTNPVMRLVYPAQYPERTGGGDLVYADNICLITAADMKNLHQATVNMRRRATWVPDVCYQYFRGKSFMLPQIRIEVNGNAEWHSLGIQLGDILEQSGIKDLSGVKLYRNRAGKLYPVYSPCKEMTLLLGDRIRFE